MRQKEADYVDARAMELVAVRHGRVGARATQQLTRGELAEVTKHILCPSRMPWDDHTNTSAAVTQIWKRVDANGDGSVSCDELCQEIRGDDQLCDALGLGKTIKRI